MSVALGFSGTRWQGVGLISMRNIVDLRVFRNRLLPVGFSGTALSGFQELVLGYRELLSGYQDQKDGLSGTPIVGFSGTALSGFQEPAPTQKPRLYTEISDATAS
jgi:hypothetical protein